MRTQRSRWHIAAGILLCVAGSVLWLGCSERKNYRLLSFFFDGVPNPNAAPGTFGAAANGPGAAAVLYTHKPYEEQNCGACHSTKNLPAFMPAGELYPELQCLKCHTKVLTEYPLIHGPVAAKACVWCHDPHQSQYKGLLKDAAPAICLQCHETALLSASIPEHLSETTSCLNCHNAHGGTARYFILTHVIPATQPTTVPSATAPSAVAPAREGMGGPS